MMSDPPAITVSIDLLANALRAAWLTGWECRGRVKEDLWPDYRAREYALDQLRASKIATGSVEFLPFQPDMSDTFRTYDFIQEDAE